jgi:hypothetical protein
MERREKERKKQQKQIVQVPGKASFFGLARYF